MARKITRRTLGMASVGAAAFAQAPTSARYTGALDTFESQVDLPSFDPVLWSRSRHGTMPLKLAFNATTRKQAEEWQKKLRAKVTELVGGFPAQRGPLSPKTLEVKEYPNYRREKLVFTSRPGVTVLAYLLTPKKASAPYSPMICLPGHGRGVEDIVAVDEQGRDRTQRVGYAYDYAVQTAEAGMAAVAIEMMAFGCRRGEAAKRSSLSANSCQPSAGAALLFGETMVGWRVWDVMRTIDWIESRKELDATKVGVMGCSGGGTATVFSTALDPRIKLAFVSSYLNTFRDSILSISHCIDNYVPGILQWAEMYDVAGLIAPRPLFVESGMRDTIFPIEASKASFARVKKVYEVFGVPDLAQQEIFDGPHGFSGKDGLPFAAKHLGVKA